MHRLYPDVPDVFYDTGLEFPELKNFVLENFNPVVLKPKFFNQSIKKYEPINFIGVIKYYGYPLISKEQSGYIYQYRTTDSEKIKDRLTYKNRNQHYCISRRWMDFVENHKEIKVHNGCCHIMKKLPSHIYAKQTGRYPFIGIMACESKQRMRKWLATGCNMVGKQESSSAPLSFWLKSDIFHCIKKYNLKYCPVYGDIVEKNGIYTSTGYESTGCIFCGFGCHLEEYPNRFQLMSKTHPKLYDFCMRGGKYDENGYWVPDNGLGMAKVLDAIDVVWWETEEQKKKYRTEYLKKEKEFAQS